MVFFSSNFEVALESMCLDTSTFHNLVDDSKKDQESGFVFSDRSTKKKTSFNLPNGKISTFGGFVVKVNENQSSFKLNFDNKNHQCKLKIGSNKILQVNMKMARVVGLLN